MRTSPEELHKIQSAFRQEGENLLKSNDGPSRSLGRSLLEVRGKIVDAIDKASGGKYKPVLSNYRDEKNIGDAFHNAFNGVFTNSKKLENLPEFTEQWVKNLSPHELEAAREGARLAIYREMGQAKNPALAGTNFAKSDFSKQRLESLFGEKEATDLLQKLEHERAIANTHNKIVEGSQTAMRSASKSQFTLPTKTDVLKTAPAVAAVEASNYFMGGMPGIGTGILAGAKVANMAKDAIKRKLAREHNLRYAKYALPTEGPDRDALIKSLEAAIPGPKQSILR